MICARKIDLPFIRAYLALCCNSVECSVSQLPSLEPRLLLLNRDGSSSPRELPDIPSIKQNEIQDSVQSLSFKCHRTDSREPLPGKWQRDLDEFQRILILRCLRADKVSNAMQDFVASHLGQRFIEPQVKRGELRLCLGYSAGNFGFLCSKNAYAERRV